MDFGKDITLIYLTCLLILLLSSFFFFSITWNFITVFDEVIYLRVITNTLCPTRLKQHWLRLHNITARYFIIHFLDKKKQWRRKEKIAFETICLCFIKVLDCAEILPLFVLLFDIHLIFFNDKLYYIFSLIGS